MGSTKIINVSKDDKFEELLGIVRKTEATEVIFVLPKKTKAFGSDEQFAALRKEAKEDNKSVAFLCSNPDVNELAKKYNFDTLSPKAESQKSSRATKTVRVKPSIVTAAANIDPYTGDEDEDIDKEPSDLDDEEIVEDEEVIEDEPPFGTEMDESGNPVYDEKEEKIGEVIVAPAKKGGQLDLDWGSKQPENIWSDISKPAALRSSFLNKFRPFKKQERSSKKGLKFSSRNFLRKGAGTLTVASLLILTFIVYLTVGSAKIEIRPKAHKISTQLKVTMSPNFSSVDGSFNRIPGQLFTISKSVSGEFNATADKDAVQKSRGTITLYNEYSTSPQPLVATTRLEYKDGKEVNLVFRTLQTVTIPGMKVENGVVTPGKVNVDIIADKAGQTYNVPAGNFGIVAWREKGDSARYEKTYGRSIESMRGGIFGKARVVSEFDYNNARDQLIAKVKNDINESLKSQSAGLELLSNVEVKIDSIKSTAKMDDAADDFTMTVNGSIATMGFKKDDLLSLISQYFDRTDGLMIIPEKLELSYKDAAMDETNGTLEVSVIMSGNAYAKIDKMNIISNLMGKNEAQIKDYIGSVKNIDSAKVILSPFWVKKIPRKEGKINFSLIF